MSGLNKAARERIIASGLSIGRYVRFNYPSGKWGGDACGCPDDRCKDGFHHQPGEECGCLPVVIAEVFREDPPISAEQWNAKYPPGTAVRYTRADGTHVDTRTRSAAWSLGHGEPVVLIENCSGGRALWALKPL